MFHRFLVIKLIFSLFLQNWPFHDSVFVLLPYGIIVKVVLWLLIVWLFFLRKFVSIYSDLEVFSFVLWFSSVICLKILLLLLVFKNVFLCWFFVGTRRLRLNLIRKCVFFLFVKIEIEIALCFSLTTSIFVPRLLFLHLVIQEILFFRFVVSGHKHHIFLFVCSYSITKLLNFSLWLAYWFLLRWLRCCPIHLYRFRFIIDRLPYWWSRWLSVWLSWLFPHILCHLFRFPKIDDFRFVELASDLCVRQKLSRAFLQKRFLWFITHI